MLRREFKVRGGCSSPALRRLASLVAAGVTLLAGPTFGDTLSGRAMIDTRMALPPGLTFEAVIEDISRADAPAQVVGRTVIENPGQPPIDFAIDYDPIDLTPRAIYALRATIRRSDMLLFTTDRITRVLDGDTTGRVEVRLRPVSRSSDAGPPPLGAHGLRLPASFKGVLPCADCEGVRHHLDLWPDQYYHMRREWLGRGDGPLRRDEVGRWYADPARNAIVLHGASEMPLFWEVKGPDRLRQMDMAGNRIASDLPYDLTSAGTLEPTELEGVFLLGRMTYMADAAVFEECFSGIRYPIAQEGDYLTLERAYLDAAPSPGAPLAVHVEGGLVPRPAMEGPPRTSMVVDRFIAVRDDDACARPSPQASLTNTYWRIDSLMGAVVGPQANRREPHIVLVDMLEARFRATVGCNQMIGRYEVEGEKITFAAAASTMMACPPPLDRMERLLREALAATRTFRLEGQSLLLLDSDGNITGELAAVYLR